MSAVALDSRLSRATSLGLHYSVAGYEFSVSSNDLSVLEQVDRVYGEFVCHLRQTPVEFGYSIAKHQRDWRVKLPHGAPLEFATPNDAVDYVCWHVSQIALTKVDHEFALHGAAVSTSDTALLILGPSGAGKSTITVELLRRGMGFLSDEAVFLSLTTGRIRGFPRGIGLSGLEDTRLGEHPICTDGNRKSYYRPAAFDGAVARGDFPVAVVVLLGEFQFPTRLTPIAPVQAIPFFLGQVFASGPADVILTAITTLLSGTKVFGLMTRDPAEAADELVELIADLSAR